MHFQGSKVQVFLIFPQIRAPFPRRARFASPSLHTQGPHLLPNSYGQRASSLRICLRPHKGKVFDLGYGIILEKLQGIPMDIYIYMEYFCEVQG